MGRASNLPANHVCRPWRCLPRTWFSSHFLWGSAFQHVCGVRHSVVLSLKSSLLLFLYQKLNLVAILSRLLKIFLVRSNMAQDEGRPLATSSLAKRLVRSTCGKSKLYPSFPWCELRNLFYLCLKSFAKYYCFS